jgi:hypothetical protein
MENELFIDDEEEIDEELPVGEGFLPEADAPPKEGTVAPVEVKLDAAGIGQTIADALSGATAAQTAAFRGLAQEFISTQPKPAAPVKTKEQIAARNTQLQALLMDTTGDVDIEEQIRAIIRPVVEDGIQGTLRGIRPEADNLSAGQGERFVSDFKRDIKAGVNEKLFTKYEAEIDKLVPEGRYGAIAQATPAQRKAFFEEIRERADGRVYRAALSDRTPRGQVTGSGGGGGKSPLQQAYNALPKEEQREGQRLAKAFCRAAGLKEGSPEFTKAFNSKLQDYVEG